MGTFKRFVKKLELLAPDVNVKKKENPGTYIGDYFHSVDVSARKEVLVTVRSYSSRPLPDAGLITFKFFDENGAELDDKSGLPYSQTVGYYSYLRSGSKSSPSITDIQLTVPMNAVRLELKGIQWRKGSGTFLLDVVESDGETLNTKSALVHSESDFGLTPVSSAAFSKQFTVEPSAESLTLCVTYRTSALGKEAPISFQFKTESGETIPPLGDSPIHPTHGSILLLKSNGSSEIGTSDYKLQIPPSASVVEISGIDWGELNATIYDFRILEQSAGSLEPLNSIAEQFLNFEKPLVLIDTTAPPLGHKTLSLRPNNMAKSYEKLGALVVFFPFSSLQEFESRVSESTCQIPRSGFSQAVRRLAPLGEKGNCHFVCSSFPSLESVTAAQFLKANGWNVVYEARDDMEEFNRVGYSKWYSPALERQILQIADHVVSVSRGLDEKLHTLSPNLGKSHVVPNAVRTEVIEDGKDLRKQRIAEKRNHSNTLGYVGHLTPSWFDWPLLTEAASKLPNITFEIIGHGAPDNLELPPNVKLLGPMSHEELLPVVENWKAGLIPFKNLPLTRAVDPNKIYEYFAWGLRCLTAPMGMVNEYPSTWVYRSVGDFVIAANEIMGSSIDPEEVKHLEDFLSTASWDDRAIKMADLTGIQFGVDH